VSRSPDAGASLIEVLISTVIVAIVIGLGSNVVVRGFRSFKDFSGRQAAEDEINTLLVRLEREYRTALPAADGIAYPSETDLQLFRDNGTTTSSELIEYVTSCQTIASGSPINGLQSPDPADCNISCAPTERVTIQRRNSKTYPGGTDVFETLPKGGGANGPSTSDVLGLAVCVTSPPGSTSLLSGTAYAYHYGADNKIHVRTRYFMFSRRADTDVTYLP
jgi:type II secretory pathway component PulJ